MARDSVDGAGDERARIRAALVELVAARGYQSTTVDHVIELAGVEPAAFHRHFASVEECFAATWEAVDGELTGLMAAAFGRRARWRDRLRDALLAGLGYLAEDDSRARLYVAEVVYVSEEMRDRQRRSLARLSATIDLGRGGEARRGAGVLRDRGRGLRRDLAPGPSADSDGAGEGPARRAAAVHVHSRSSLQGGRCSQGRARRLLISAKPLALSSDAWGLEDPATSPAIRDFGRFTAVATASPPTSSPTTSASACWRHSPPAWPSTATTRRRSAR